MKKVCIIFLFVFSLPLSAFFDIAGGQGYGSFNLAGTGNTKAASIMYAGIRFNRYIEFKYLSLDTSIRMPVLPFRLFDVNYNKRTTGGFTKYTSYDSDVFGLNFSLPINNIWSVSALYGLGRSKITEVTQNGAGDDDAATLHKGLVHVVDLQTSMSFNWGESFIVSPMIGWMIHFLDNKSSYANASSVYAAVTVSYLLKK
jgi:outer membrane protein assembly factor BamA